MCFCMTHTVEDTTLTKSPINPIANDESLIWEWEENNAYYRNAVSIIFYDYILRRVVGMSRLIVRYVACAL